MRWVGSARHLSCRVMPPRVFSFCPKLVNFCAGLLEVPHRQSPDYWPFIVIFIYFMQLDIMNFAFTTQLINLLATHSWLLKDLAAEDT